MRILRINTFTGWTIYLYPRDHTELRAFTEWLNYSLPGYRVSPDLRSLQPLTCIVTGSNASDASAIELVWL